MLYVIVIKLLETRKKYGISILLLFCSCYISHIIQYSVLLTVETVSELVAVGLRDITLKCTDIQAQILGNTEKIFKEQNEFNFSVINGYRTALLASEEKRSQLEERMEEQKMELKQYKIEEKKWISETADIKVKLEKLRKDNQQLKILKLKITEKEISEMQNDLKILREKVKKLQREKELAEEKLVDERKDKKKQKKEYKRQLNVMKEMFRKIGVGGDSSSSDECNGDDNGIKEDDGKYDEK